MKCNHAVALFDSYLKGNATQEEKTALENHIATCKICKKQLDLYRFYFTDVKIENDFPVPSQLNAKIKYTIHQAKGKKKVPFWRSKHVLSFATACTFMLVAGIWGISHYAQLQNYADTPVTETAAPASTPAGFTKEQIPEPSPVAPVTTAAPVESRRVPDPKTPVASTNPAALTQTNVTPETQPQVPAYSGDMADMTTGNSGRIAFGKQSASDSRIEHTRQSASIYKEL